MTSSDEKCKHGHDCYTDASVDDDEMSSCCGAFVSYSGDGDLYCKCCYGSITAGEPIQSTTIKINP